MIEQRRGYEAYLLRLWQARGEDGMAWRASIESADTGERVSFARLEELISFFERGSRREAPDRAGRCAPGESKDTGKGRDRSCEP